MSISSATKGRLHIVTPEHRLVEQPLAAFHQYAAFPCWIDLHQYDTAALMQFLAPFDLHELVLEAVDATHPTSNVGLYRNALLMQLPATTADGLPATLSLIVTGQTVISVHPDEIPAFESVLAQFRHTDFQFGDVAMLLFELLDHVVDEGIVQALALRKLVDGLEQSFDEATEAFEPDDVSQLRRQVVTLESVLEDQHYCVGGLQKMAIEIFKANGIHDYLRDSLAHLEHAIRVVGRLADRLAALQQHYLLKLEEHQSQKLRVLTIVSTVFLPLMLIAGIYGMNFRYMPELHWRYGYPAVLGFVLLIAAALVCLLYKKGWFK